MLPNKFENYQHNNKLNSTRKKQPQANKTKQRIHKKKHKTHQKIIIKDKLTKGSRPTGLTQTQSKSMHNHHIANTKESCKHTKKTQNQGKHFKNTKKR